MVVSFAQATDGDCSLSGGVACSTSGLKSSEFAAGVAYDFSKRTFVFALFSRLTNGESALFDNWSNGTPAQRCRHDAVRSRRNAHFLRASPWMKTGAAAPVFFCVPRYGTAFFYRGLAGCKVAGLTWS